MSSRKLTAEQIEEIKALRAQGHTTGELSSAFGVAASVISYHTNSSKKKDDKVCPVCKKKMDGEANYCSRCGADIRDERDVLIEQIVTLRGLIVHLPENARSKADAITKDVVAYLKKQK